MSRNTIDTNKMQVGKDESYIVPATGDIDHSDFMDEFEIVDRIDMKEAEMAAFMEEELVVQLQKPGERNAPLGLITCVQGRTQYFIKGLRQKVKRKYVAVLAQAKHEFIQTPEIMHDGVRTTKIERSSALEHPFTVLHDPNPMGHRWLEGMLAEG